MSFNQHSGFSANGFGANYGKGGFGFSPYFGYSHSFVSGREGRLVPNFLACTDCAYEVNLPAFEVVGQRDSYVGPSLWKGLHNGANYAGYASGGFGLGQIGMLEYRRSMSINSKIGTFGRFSKAYSSIGMASKYLGLAGIYVGAPLTTYFDYESMKNEQISRERFAYRTVGNVSSLGTGIAVGSSVGPYGAAAGLLVGTGFLAGEIIYDAGIRMRNEIARQIHNFNKALYHGWYPRR